MSEFYQENNSYLAENRENPYTGSSEAPRYGEQYDRHYAEPPCEEERYREPSGASRFFSLPARIGMWFVGVIVGLTLIFGCGIFWVWGLNYIGLIDTDRNVPPTNEFNSPNGDDYSEFEDFYNYFDDYFGGMPGNGGSSGQESQDSQPTAGIGVTIQEVTLEFTIEDTYDAGLIIVDINEKGALAGTEAKVGDLIVAVNGEKCTTIDELDVFLKETGIGGVMTLTVARYTNGVAATFEVPITLIDVAELN